MRSRAERRNRTTDVTVDKFSTCAYSLRYHARRYGNGDATHAQSPRTRVQSGFARGQRRVSSSHRRASHPTFAPPPDIYSLQITIADTWPWLRLRLGLVLWVRVGYLNFNDTVSVKVR